jgi:hypothetical protein
MAFAIVSPSGQSWSANKTASTSISLTYNTYSAGTLIIVAVAIDNISTGGGSTSDITVTDNADNNFIKVEEFSNAGNAATAATVALWYSVLTNAVTNTSSVTASFSSVTARVMCYQAFTIGAGSTIAVQDFTTSQVDGGNVASLTLSSLPSREYLFLRASAVEAETSGTTFTSGYAAYGSPANDLTTSGGGAASNMALLREYDIATGTSSTSAPTTTSGDNASIFAALYEVTAQPKNYGFIIGG